MRRLVIAAWMTALLAGCAHAPAQPGAPVTVEVPVPVSCVPADYPPRPAPVPTAAQLKAAQDAAARYQMLAEWWNEDAPYDAMEDVVVADCRKAAPAPK